MERPAPPAAPDPLVGVLVDGRWRVLRCIGRGAVGIVYLAERANLGRQVALKLLHPKSARRTTSSCGASRRRRGR